MKNKNAFTLVELPAMSKRAFTLVELLVVVAIIVVLLALLVPGMEKAMYQAALTNCAIFQKGIATGVVTYAHEHKKFYPYRQMAYDDGAFNYGLKAPVGFSKDKMGTDDRPVLKGYVDLRMLVDPLCAEVDLSLGVHPSNEAIYTNYVLWFAWKYQGERGMMKLDESLHATDTRDNKNPQTYKLDWLVSDLDIIGQQNSSNTASHPDKLKLLHPEYAQAGKFNYEDETEGTAYNAAVTVTYSFWRQSVNYNRGPMDLNTAASDGSVFRLTDVKYDGDSRVASLPSTTNKGIYPGVWINVAKP